MHLAQMNISKVKYDLDSPEMDDFLNGLAEVNRVAESYDGFIWRLMDDAGNNLGIKVFDDPRIIVNMSVWYDEEALKHFVYSSTHVDFLKRKKDWFERLGRAHQVMWWVPMHTIPPISEGKKRLLHLEQEGESPYAFTFRHVFPERDAIIDYD